MHNPLALFSPQMLKVMIDMGFTIFVRQSYPRGKDHFNNEIKEALLITPYRDIGLANQHFQYIRFDKRKYIYQVHHAEELQKLHKAVSQPEGYRVYIDKIAAKEWKAPPQMKTKVANYIRLNTKWKRQDGDIGINLFLHYGDLMLRISNGSEEIKILLSEIERL